MDVNLSPMGFGPSSTVVEIEALLGRDKEDVKSRERVRTRGNVLTMTADVAYHTPIDEHGFVGTAGDVFVTPALAIRTIVGLPIRFSVDPPLGCTAYAGAEIKTWEILDGDNSEGEVRKYLSAYETDAKKIPETADAWNRERAKKEIAPSMEDEHWNTVSEVTVFDIVNVRIPQAQSSCAEARDLLWCNGGDDTATGWTSTLINKINNPYRPIKIKTLCGGQIDLQGVEDCVSTADRPRSRCGRKHDITFTSPFTSANPTHVNFCATKQKMAVPSGITNPSASNDDFCDGVVGSKTPWCEALLKLRVSVLGILGWRRAVELNEELKVAAGKVSQVFGGSPVLPQVPVLLPDGPSAGKRMQSQNEEPALDIDGSTGHGRRLFVQRKAIEAGINHLIGDPESHAGGRVHGLSAEQKEALESSFAAESEKLFDPVLNDKLKASASIMSFGGGGDEMTNTFETTTTRTLVIEAADETERGVGGIVHFGLTVSGVAMVQDGGIGGARQNSNARSVVRSVSETTAVVYTLGDEDIGDFFDVLVKRDPVYGTPVFRTLSGRSECAHEFGTASRHVWDTHFDVELNTLDVEGSSLNRKVRDLTRKTAPGTCIRFDMIIESFGLHVSYSYDTVTRLDWELIRPSDGDFAGVNAQIMDSGFAEMSALNTIFPGQSRRFRVRFCPATADGQGGPDNNFVARKKRLIKTGTYKKPGDEFVFCGLKVATVLMCENALGSDSGLTKLWMGEAKTKKGLRMCGDQVNIHGSMTPLGPCQDKILTNIFDKEDMALVEERVLDDAMVLRCVSFDRSRPCSVGDVQRECIGAGAPTPQPTPKPTPRPTLPPFDTSTLNPTTMPTPLTSASPTAAAVSPPTSEPTPHPSCGGAVGRDECAKVARYPSLCHTDKYKNSCWECGVCQ